VSDSEGSSSKIKVVDRRWFTEEGDPRPDRPASAQPATEGAKAAPVPTAAKAAPVPAAAKAPPPSTSQDFIALVAMVAQQAELMMVGAEGLAPHPEEARRLIDCLGALELKTRGNLSPEESQILSNLLYQLRSAFVQARR
jgi:hypothetical protein